MGGWQALWERAGEGPWTVVEAPWPEPWRSAESRGVSLRAARRRLVGAEGRDLGEVRAVHLAGERAEVVNVFAYPAPGLEVPTVAMEFVRFGGRIVAAVIDLPWLGSVGAPPGWCERERARWKRWPDLPPADDPPEWFQECRSGGELFTRPTASTAAASLEVAWEESWAVWVATLGAARPEPDPARHAVAQQAYREHHRAHTPGRPFLVRTFGEGWSEGFLREAFFAP